MAKYDWLEELHAVHYPTLLRLAQNRLRSTIGSIAEAEDVVQDVFLLAAEKDIQHLQNPLAWMMKATSNLCKQRMDRIKLDARKTQRFIQQKTDNSADRSVYAVEREESETDALLWLLLLEQNLSPEEWEIMQKYCLKGVPLDTLAKELGVSYIWLKVRICRIRRKLRKISQ